MREAIIGDIYGSYYEYHPEKLKSLNNFQKAQSLQMIQY